MLGGCINHDKKDGLSIYCGAFENENYIHKAEGFGDLFMAINGSNTSQFTINFDLLKKMNGNNVCFGKVIHGFGVLE